MGLPRLMVKKTGLACGPMSRSFSKSGFNCAVNGIVTYKPNKAAQYTTNDRARNKRRAASGASAIRASQGPSGDASTLGGVCGSVSA